jgi:hypothetical protein
MRSCRIPLPQLRESLQFFLLAATFHKALSETGTMPLPPAAWFFLYFARFLAPAFPSPRFFNRAWRYTDSVEICL